MLWVSGVGEREGAGIAVLALGGGGCELSERRDKEVASLVLLMGFIRKTNGWKVAFEESRDGLPGGVMVERR